MKLPLLLLLTASLWWSCDPGEPPRQQGTSFLFYPRTNIYFDLENKEYYTFDSSLGSWQRREKIEVPQESLGKKVVLTQVADPVYQDNEQHRFVYGTALYASSADVQRKYIEDSLSSIPPPIPKPEKDKKKPEKDGFLKDIIDKIFKPEKKE